MDKNNEITAIMDIATSEYRRYDSKFPPLFISVSEI